jgi:hypothetical protein
MLDDIPDLRNPEAKEIKKRAALGLTMATRSPCPTPR